MVRTIASQCYFHLSSTQATLTLTIASFNNFILLHDTITLNGPLQGTVQIQGKLEIESAGLGGVSGLLITDASGTTTGKVVEFRKNDTTPYFSIYAGTDASFPGTVQTRDILPLSNLAWKLGNAGLIWLEHWLQDLILASSTAHGVLIGQGGAAVTSTTAGTAGEVLTSNGASADPTFQAAGSGTINHLTANCNSTLTCTGSYADVSGATITLTETGSYLILATMQAGLDVSANQVFVQLVVNGVAQTGEIEATLATGSGTDSIGVSASRNWIYSNTGSNIAKLQGKKTGGGGTGQVKTPGTVITAIFLG